MQTFFIKRAITFLSVFVGLVLLTAFKATDPITLLDEAVSFKPTQYYIAGVTDERVDKNSVAQLIIKLPENKTTTQSVDLQGGVAAALSRFIEHNVPKDKSLSPVTISIKEFKLTETALPDGGVDGKIKLQLSFGFEKDYGTEHLVDYNGALHYIRNGNNVNIEPRLRSLLKNGLVYFNDWMKANAGLNRKLAQNVKISFSDYTEKTEADTIYYAPNRPLTWADFQAKNKSASVADAEVMPAFGYEQHADVTNGTINVQLTMKVYLPKSASWANYYTRDAYGLNHEQRHFDIAKIIAEQFKQKILAEKLTPDTFEAFINMQYLDSYRDMNTMQKAYDNETSHSRNEAAQNIWNKRIDKELKATTANIP